MQLRHLATSGPQFIIVLGLFLYHGILALYFRIVRGVNPELNPIGHWDNFWQTVSLDLLMRKPIESLWNLHSVPPLHNALMAVLVRVSDSPVQLLHYIHIVLGATIAPMLLKVMVDNSISFTIAAILSMVIATDPSLFLYEAYPLYDLITAFLCVVTVFCISRFQVSTGRIWLVMFTAAIALLALERSTFHFMFVGLIVSWGTYLARGWRLPYLAVAAILCLPLMIVIGKNKEKFDVLGTSSWAGLSAWKVATYNYPLDDVASLVSKGEVPFHVGKFPAFNPPSAYDNVNYTTTSQIEVLNRDDYHNIGIPAISRDYGASALAFVKAFPGHYLTNIGHSYYRFCMSPANFEHMKDNGVRMEPLRTFYTLGEHSEQETEILTCSPVTIIYFFAFPLAFGMHGFLLIFRSSSIASEPVMLYFAAVIGYVVLISAAMEILEGNRYKLYITHIFLAYVALLIKATRGHRHKCIPTCEEGMD